MRNIKFLIQDKMFKKYGEETGILKDKRHFHTLRHSRGIHRVEGGKI